jgi:DNA adenine methylase
VLRWAGGKRWLVPKLTELLVSTTVARYHEPFLGGAAVFLGLPFPSAAFLSDYNAELISVYRTVGSAAQDVQALYASWGNDSETYYELRGLTEGDELHRAARFIYLNHHSFNGIYRVNLRGEYNVPFGARAAPNMPSLAHLEAASRKFAAANLRAGDFADSLDEVQANDLVFLDPPYVTNSDADEFAKYTQHVYSYRDQERLAQMLDGILVKKANFILTNAAHSSISKLFRKYGRMIRITRKNSIGGKEAARGRADEYLFTNIKLPKGGLS